MIYSYTECFSSRANSISPILQSSLFAARENVPEWAIIRRGEWKLAAIYHSSRLLNFNLQIRESKFFSAALQTNDNRRISSSSFAWLFSNITRQVSSIQIPFFSLSRLSGNFSVRPTSSLIAKVFGRRAVGLAVETLPWQETVAFTVRATDLRCVPWN